MNSFELRIILKEIMDGEAKGLKWLAEESGLNRSNLSTILNAKHPKNVSALTERKLRNRFPNYFQKLTETNTTVPETLYDSKESILRMLEKALDANIEHASANTKNAAASEKNATALIELVKLLDVKLSSIESAPASASSPGSGDKQPVPEEHIPVFGGKSKNRSVRKRNKNVKSISS